MIVAVVPVVCLATNVSHERCVRACQRVRAVRVVSTLKRGLGLWVPLGYVLTVEASERACARAPTSLTLFRRHFVDDPSSVWLLNAVRRYRRLLFLIEDAHNKRRGILADYASAAG